MVNDVCALVMCQKIHDPLWYGHFSFLFITGIAVILLILNQNKIAKWVLVLTTLYGILALVLAFGPESVLIKYNLESFFAIRLMTYTVHLTTTMISVCLLAMSIGRRFVHDSVLYLTSAIGIVLINLWVLFKRHFSTGFSSDTIPGDNITHVLMGLLLSGLLLYQAIKMVKGSPFTFKRLAASFSVSLVTLVLILTLSFKLQKDEIELLKGTQSLFVNSLELSIKETLDNEVIPLNLLMNIKDDTQALGRDATLEVARGVLFSRKAMQSLHWITPRGNLAWSIKKSEKLVGKSSLLKPPAFYPKVTEQADVAIVTSENLSQDSRVEIVVPYTSLGMIRAYVVAQTDFSTLLDRAVDQVELSRFSYGLYLADGTSVATNIDSVSYPSFSSRAKFDIFGKSFILVTATTVEGLGEFITFLPKFTLIFGFFGALLFGHLFFVYSNLLVSYDEVEKMVEDRTSELEDARRVSEAANQTKTLFLANISHEIRTPLNILSGVSDMLSETKLNGEQKQYVSMFKQSCSNLLGLVNDLIDMSKVESGKIELENIPFDLKSFLDEIAQLYRIKASEKGIQLILSDSDVKHHYYVGDPLRLKQVLGNILINAIKFTDTGAVTITTSTDDQNVIFKITDTGIGIPSEKIDMIFERFEQIDKTITRNRGGAGLGLAIAKDLIAKMNGRVDVSSEQGMGTTFMIRIPLEKTTEIPVRTDKRDPKTVVQLPKGLKVLVTDDSPDNRELVKVYLKNFPVEVEEAENGLVALDKIKSKKFDVILMDMQMPILDGYTATRKIRDFENESDRGHAPIIALTAHALREDSQKCLAAGCNAYLPKPVSKRDLIEKLASLI